MSDLIERLLAHLSLADTAANSLHLAQQFSIDHQKLIGAINSIQAHGALITATPIATKRLQLTPEGQHFVDHGSHEAAIFYSIPAEGALQSGLMAQPNAKVGFSKAMSNGWVKVDKTAPGGALVLRKVEAIEDQVQAYLKQLAAGEALTKQVETELKKRKLVQEVTIKSFDLERGAEFALALPQLETDLTSEMIASGSWATAKFKAYNFRALGVPPDCGHLHPLLKVRSEFRQIFLEMGFSEMPTNNYVESSFWNFDALFQPQQHPARDAHDTFFLSAPATSGEFPPEYVERVRRVHSEGGHGSIGYRYEWRLEEAQKNLLRTHTTAVSARMLYALGQRPAFEPVKLFSIDKVFRNETLDATHLAEFHQVEGVIADYGVTLGDLIGVFAEFFRKLGIDQLEFKPAYNPYTEPSMEIFCFHKGLGRWIELGNSGMFRPEMLRPMGLPEGVRVIAWGLSLERPTMIKYGLNNIRDLVGPKVDLEMVQRSPLCRLDK